MGVMMEDSGGAHQAPLHTSHYMQLHQWKANLFILTLQHWIPLFMVITKSNLLIP